MPTMWDAASSARNRGSGTERSAATRSRTRRRTNPRSTAAAASWVSAERITARAAGSWSRGSPHPEEGAGQPLPHALGAVLPTEGGDPGRARRTPRWRRRRPRPPYRSSGGRGRRAPPAACDAPGRTSCRSRAGRTRRGPPQDPVAGARTLRPFARRAACRAPCAAARGAGHGTRAAARCCRVNARASARSASVRRRTLARRVLTSTTTCPSKPVRARCRSSSAHGCVPRPRHQVLVLPGAAPVGEVDVAEPVAHAGRHGEGVGACGGGVGQVDRVVAVRPCDVPLRGVREHLAVAVAPRVHILDGEPHVRLVRHPPDAAAPVPRVPALLAGTAGARRRSTRRASAAACPRWSFTHGSVDHTRWVISRQGACTARDRAPGGESESRRSASGPG